jgi:hypothetical protein
MEVSPCCLHVSRSKCSLDGNQPYDMEVHVEGDERLNFFTALSETLESAKYLKQKKAKFKRGKIDR